MRLRRLRLQDYRGVASCDVELLLEGQSAGVTIVEGPNEVGKTSLAEAIRLLWDFPHSSRHRDVRAVQPVGRDVGTRICLDGDGGEVAFTYTKVFNRDAKAELSIRRPRTEQLTGKEAHERAATLLADMVDVDFWRALQVPQGTVAQADVMDSAALGAALARSGGQAVVDERDGLVAGLVTAERARWRTAAGRDRAALTDVRAEAERLRAERDQAAAVLEAVRVDLEEIERLEIVIPQQREAVTASSRELATLGKELAALDDLTERARELERATELARSFADRARRDLDARRELRREADEAMAAARDALARVDDETDLRSATAAFQSADADLRQARVEARRCAEELARAEAACDRLRDEQQVRELGARRERVAQVTARLDAADDAIAAVRLDATTMAALRDADADVVRARATLSAAGAAIRVTALADTSIGMDGDQPVAMKAGETVAAQASGPLQLVVADVARLDIFPGSGTESLTVALERATDRRAALLDAAGFPDVGAAEAAWDTVAALRRDRDAAAAERTGLLADMSADDLDRALQAAAARLQRHADASPADDGGSDLETARCHRDRVRGKVARADDRVRLADDRAKRARDALDALQQDRQEARTRAEVAAATHRQAAERLERQRAALADDALDAELARRRRQLEDAIGAQQAVRRQLDAADGESLRERAASLEAAVRHGSETVRESLQRNSALEAAVAARSADGPGSRLDELQTRLERAERTLHRHQRRADAAELLEEIFARRRDDQRRKYLAPLAEQIEHLGRILWGPSFAVELGDDLRIHTRVLDGRGLPYDQLSLGAQEQLALIGRLACAIVVGPGGAPLIVDDALGFSDPERLRRMGAVLAVAGRSCQIILLTCHPQRYLHVTGARTVQLRSGIRDRAAIEAA